MNFPDIEMEGKSIARSHHNGELHQYTGETIF